MNKNFFVLVLVATLLNGCSQYHRYQSPAPIFGKSKGSNPYKQQAGVTTEPYHRNESPLNSKKPSDDLPLNPNTRREQPQIIEVERKASPAVLALVSEADRSSQAGDLESAVVTIERALRIDSRNPDLTYRLAILRLQQSKPRLAEDLAKKAALLSANNRALKKKSWLLISEARKQQSNYFGAEEALRKANEL